MPLQHPERRPAVVAGASAGIGAATAIALAGAGYPVALGARRVDRCEEVAAAIRDSGGEAVAHVLDVADDESAAKFAAAVRSDLGEVEVVVCNAGYNQPARVVDVTSEGLQRHLDVNILGPQRMVTQFSPHMLAEKRGDLVFISSDVVQTFRPYTGAYNAAKTGLEGLVLTLQKELEGTGIRASLVRPGPTITEMGFDWDPELTTAVIDSWVRFGLARFSRFLPVEALANAVLTIVSAPRGTHLTAIEVQPEAPVSKEAEKKP